MHQVSKDNAFSEPIIPGKSSVWAHRTEITHTTEQDVNFAGHYSLVEWSCGTYCQSGVIVDKFTGLWSILPTGELGTEFRKDKDLLIVNPELDVILGADYDKLPVWLFRRFYLLKKGHFVLVRKDKGDKRYSSEQAFDSFPILQIQGNPCRSGCE